MAISIRLHANVGGDSFNRDELTGIAIIAGVVILAEVSRFHIVRQASSGVARQNAVGALHQAVDVGSHRWELLPRLVAFIQVVERHARHTVGTAIIAVVEVESHT